MSRSYKKTFGFTDSNKWYKKQANRKVRQLNNIGNHTNYKKVYNSWKISDWKYLFYSIKELKKWASCPHGDERVYKYYIK